MNKYKNEALIKLGEVEILLRPTFENLSSFESNVISLDEWSIRLVKGRLPALSQLVQAIYYFQAEKKYNLEQINELVLNHDGLMVTTQVFPFIGACVGGYKNKKDVDESIANVLSAAEKKS